MVIQKKPNDTSKSMINSAVKDLQDFIGKGNVLSSIEDRYCYSYDSKALTNKLYLPDIVITPESTTDIQNVVKIANKYSLPLIPRGAATNLSGACLPVEAGIMIHVSKMNRIIEIDTENLVCVVEPGVITEQLQKTVETHGLFYPPDPASLRVSTIGGNVAVSSSGPRCFKYGGTKDYVLGLKAVLANGEIIEVGGKTIKNVTGYNLTQLFVGSEGTLGIITEVTLKLIPLPEYKKTMLVIFNDINDAAITVSKIISNKIVPTTLELLDQKTMQTIEKFHPTGLPIDAEASLLIEIDGFQESVERQVKQIVEICKNMGVTNFKVASNREESEELWFARRSAYGAVSRLKPNVVVEDATVPRVAIPDMLKAIKKIGAKYNLTICLMGHIGDGNLHPNISFDMNDVDEVERVKQGIEEIFNAAISLGGTLSGEHGVGFSKSVYLPRVLNTETIDLMKHIKKHYDPNNIMNPGKIWQ